MKKILLYFSYGEKPLWRKTGLVSNLEKKKLIPYPLSFAHIVTENYFQKFDPNGVPFKISGRGQHYNPTAVCGYAFGSFELFCKYQRRENRDSFLKQANWLLNSQRVEEHSGKKIGVWIYDYDDSYFGVKSPWISGMAQGQAISVLLRAYALSDDERYLNAVGLAFESFKVDLAEGGVTIVDPKGSIFFEEAPSDPPCHVLNGFLFAVIGIKEFYDVTGDKTALSLFDQAVATLERTLAFYDLGFWSSYDLSPGRFKNPASLWYHDLHIALLDILFDITDKKFFYVYSRRWLRYRISLWNRVLGLSAKLFYKSWRKLARPNLSYIERA